MISPKCTKKNPLGVLLLLGVAVGSPPVLYVPIVSFPYYFHVGANMTAAENGKFVMHLFFHYNKESRKKYKCITNLTFLAAVIFAPTWK